MKKMKSRILLPVLALLAAGPTLSFAEEILPKCTEERILNCQAAMEGRNFLVRWAIGVNCVLNIGICMLIPYDN